MWPTRQKGAGGSGGRGSRAAEGIGGLHASDALLKHMRVRPSRPKLAGAPAGAPGRRHPLQLRPEQLRCEALHAAAFVTRAGANSRCAARGARALRLRPDALFARHDLNLGAVECLQAAISVEAPRRQGLACRRTSARYGGRLR